MEWYLSFFPFLAKLALFRQKIAEKKYTVTTTNNKILEYCWRTQ